MSGNCLTPYAWWNNCSLTRISFSHIYCTPDLYPFKDLISISYFMFARAYFLGNEIFTKNANFLLLIWQNCQLIMIMWCSHMFSLLCPTFTLWPRKSSIFPIFVIYNPRFCPFVHFVIVQYCIYCPIYYLCYRPMYRPKGHPRRKYI